jgi:hypothetical protein
MAIHCSYDSSVQGQHRPNVNDSRANDDRKDDKKHSAAMTFGNSSGTLMTQWLAQEATTLLFLF